MADVGTCLPHRPKINDQQSLRLAKGDGFKDPFISGTIFHVDSIPDLYLIKVAFKRPPATVPKTVVLFLEAEPNGFADRCTAHWDKLG